MNRLLLRSGRLPPPVICQLAWRTQISTLAAAARWKVRVLSSILMRKRRNWMPKQIRLSS